MAEQVLPFFVYGTLLPNQPNFYLFEDSVVSTESAMLLNAQLYAMQYAPMLAEGTQGKVNGAIMHVSAEKYPHILTKLDTLEGYKPTSPETSLYQRVVRAVQTERGESLNAWVYIGKPAQVKGLSLIGDDWVSFSAENAEKIASWWRGDANPSGEA